MPPIAEEMGPGTLSVGAVGTALDFTAQCIKAEVTWKADAKDSKRTLSGETVGGGRTYSAQLKATVYQDDLEAGGMIDFTWAQRGKDLPFSFVPTTGGRGVSGVVTVDPIDIGGDVGGKNTSDFTWDCVGEPDLTDDLA